MNHFKWRNVPPCPLLLKSRRHMFGVDTVDLASFQNREGQVKSKTCWCHAAANGRCCQWLFTEPPDQRWACLEDVVLSGVCHLRHIGVRGCWPVGFSDCVTPPSTSRYIKVGPHALVQLHRFIIPFHRMFVVSVLCPKLFCHVSLSSYVFSLSLCLYGIKSTLFYTG